MSKGYVDYSSIFDGVHFVPATKQEQRKDEGKERQRQRQRQRVREVFVAHRMVERRRTSGNESLSEAGDSNTKCVE